MLRSVVVEVTEIHAGVQTQREPIFDPKTGTSRTETDIRS